MRKKKCPQCGSTRTLPIVYGLPDSELERKAMSGELVLGGCVIWDGQPDRHCRDCEHVHAAPEYRGLTENVPIEALDMGVE